MRKVKISKFISTRHEIIQGWLTSESCMFLVHALIVSRSENAPRCNNPNMRESVQYQPLLSSLSANIRHANDSSQSDACMRTHAYVLITYTRVCGGGGSVSSACISLDAMIYYARGGTASRNARNAFAFVLIWRYVSCIICAMHVYVMSE
jgi:hypothetical protein